MRCIALMYFLQVTSGQIDEAKCGVTSCCFRFPSTCSGTSCDILIAFQYNSTGVLDVEVGTRKSWVAFGLNNVRSQMGDTAGELCMRTTPSPRLIGFKNSGTTPDFGVATNGLNVKSTVVQNNFLVCRYSRPMTPPSGSYMLDLNTNLYITAAFGESVSGSDPQYHGPPQSSTSSSPSKIDFKKPCSISGTKPSATNVIVHGCLMVIAWICFASSGIFIARFTRPLGGDESCLGKRIWFQSHRVCMVTALLLTIAGIIVIFVHKKAWSEGAGAHPILGLVVSLLAVVQPIMAAFRPHPDEESRWLFNWAHRIVGVSAVIIAAATIMLGLDLFKANNIATIIWIVACVVLAIVLEIGIQVIGKSSSAAEFNSAKNTVGVQVLETDTSTTFRTAVTGFAMVSFFALGVATVGLIAAKA